MVNSRIRYRAPAPADVDALSALLEQHSVTLVGLGDQQFLRAVLTDATTHGPVNMVVADSDGEIIGWSIALVDSRRYWKTFMLRHPALAARILRQRMARKPAHAAQPEHTAHANEMNGDIQWPSQSSIDWGISRKSIAKHIDITILKSFRSSGIGRQLQNAHLASLRRNGVERMDAVISKKNAPSIHFHIKQGWSFVKSDSKMLYITKAIDHEIATCTSDCLPWNPQQVSLPLTLGEVRLFSFRFKGIRSNPDIFQVSQLGSLPPPRSSLKEAGAKCAYVYSCPLERPLPTFSLVDRYMRYVSQQYRHYYVRIHDRFEDYLASFNKKTLSTLKRKVNKAEASNQHTELFTTYTRPEEMDRFFDVAVPISKVSYQDRLLGHGLPDTPEYREQIKQEAAEGRVRGFVLFVEDKPAAYTLCPIYGDGVILYGHTGYDPDLSKHSPGTVLQYKIIESLHADGTLKFYDLCTGEGRHKELFATDAILCANVYFFPLTPHHLACVSSRLGLHAATSGTKLVLDRLGLKEKFKKVIRRQWR